MSEQPAKDNYTTDGIYPTYKNKYERRIKSMMWPVDAITKVLNEVEAEEPKDDSAAANGHVGPPPEHVKVVGSVGSSGKGDFKSPIVIWTAPLPPSKTKDDVSIAHGSVDAVMADPTFEPNE